MVSKEQNTNYALLIFNEINKMFYFSGVNVSSWNKALNNHGTHIKNFEKEKNEVIIHEINANIKESFQHVHKYNLRIEFEGPNSTLERGLIDQVSTQIQRYDNFVTSEEDND